MIEPGIPAAVVEGGDCLKVFPDPFKVASLLMDCGVAVPIEGKGKYFLARTTLPRVSRAGRRVVWLKDSEEKVQRRSLTFHLEDVCGILLGHPQCSSSNVRFLFEQFSPDKDK